MDLGRKIFIRLSRQFLKDKKSKKKFKDRNFYSENLENWRKTPQIAFLSKLYVAY